MWYGLVFVCESGIHLYIKFDMLVSVEAKIFITVQLVSDLVIVVACNCSFQ